MECLLMENSSNWRKKKDWDSAAETICSGQQDLRYQDFAVIEREISIRYTIYI